MWQCPKCGLEVEDSLKWCSICGTQRDTAAQAEIPLAWVVAERVPEPSRAIQTVRVGKDPGVERVRPAAGVPRRFGLGKLMLITAFFAVLFAVLRCLDAHPIVFVVVAGFVTVVGLSQAILFSGKRPRRASVVTGSVLCALMPVVGFLVFVPNPGRHLGLDVVLILAVQTALSAVAGGIFGYVVGCLVAAIFLGKGSSLPEAGDHPSEPADPFCPDAPIIGPPDDPPRT